ncbi:hypothetical protein BH11PLA2_BH11PLA2_06380 [soil metagenome]
MRWLITLGLAVLVAAGGAWLAFGSKLKGTVAEAPSAALAVLREQVKPDTIRRIDRMQTGQESVVLTRNADGTWSQPGNWPVRKEEADKLAALLADVKTRFQPLAVPADKDLKAFGLNAGQNPVVVKLDAGAKTLTLTFGQPAVSEKESAFARPTYLRIDDQPELLRLGPDVYAALTRPAEDYRRRQLFPEVSRVKVSGAEPPPNPMSPTPPAATNSRITMLSDKVTGIKAESPLGGYVLQRTSPTPVAAPDADKPSAEPVLPSTRLAEAWELKEVEEPGTTTFKPLKDHVDPAKLKGILTAVPELWAESFVTGKTVAELGLDKPERSLSLTLANGQTVALRIGKIARTVMKAAPPPQPFSQTPPPPPKIEEYYYAKLDNNPLLFEIKGDKLADLFAAPDELRDASVARIDPNDVAELTITAKDKPPIVITKKKGNKDAEKDDDKQDRWYQGDRLAEAAKVTELLDSLTRLDAKTKEDRIDNADAKKLAELGFDVGATKVTITAAGKKYEYILGKADAEKKKLNVQLAGWPRINVVPDDLVKLVDRPALAYRGRRLFDTAEAKLTSFVVNTPGGETFELREDADKKWKLAQPFHVAADEAKSSQMIGDLSRLEVTDFVDDAPKPEDLDKKYGLAKPSMTIKLAFTGKGVKDQTLEIGAGPEFKPEMYAKLAGTNSVFTLPKATIESLKSGAAGLLPLQLWQVPADKVAAVEVQRDGGEKYKLNADGGNWKISGPFDAPVPMLVAQPLLAAAANLKADKYEAVTVPDAAKYGLDKPTVKIAVTYKETVGDKDETITKTLLVGKPTAEGANTRFARLEGSPNTAVFVIPDALVKEADKPALERLDRTLMMIDPQSIAKVSVTGPKPEDSVTLVKDKETWKAEGKPYAVDPMTAQMLVSVASRPTAQKLAAYGSNLNFAEYGLDKPENTVTTTAGGEKPVTHVIKLGKAAPGGGRYARVDDGPAVAILAEQLAKALTPKPLEFVDRTLFNFDPAAIAGMTRKEGTDVLEIVPGTVAGWEIVLPSKTKADQLLLDELTEQLSRLRVTSVAAYEPADLETFGLKQPLYMFTFKVGLEKPEDKVLKVGLETDEGKTGDRYATVDGKTVGVLPGALVEKLTAAPLKFRDRTLAKFIDADRATLVRGDRTVTFVKLNGTWKMMKPVTADAEQGELDELLNAVAKLRAAELIADKPANLKEYGLDKPEEVWTFANGDMEVLKLSLGSRDKSGTKVYAKVNGSDIVALLDAPLTNRLTAEYRKRAVWTGVDAAQVDTIAVSSGMTNFAFRKQGMAWVDSSAGEPVNAAAVTELLDTLAGLKASKYVTDEKADLKLYGLEPPQRVIVLTAKGGPPKTLHLGREEGGKGGRYYAKVADADRTDVFVISEADAAKLMKDRGAYKAK